MEAWTSGLVSKEARDAWKEMRPGSEASFSPERRNGRRGWRMHGWESQLATARAMGRGRRRGLGLPAHAFDMIGEKPVAPKTAHVVVVARA